MGYQHGLRQSYETMSQFVKVMQRKLWTFSGRDADVYMYMCQIIKNLCAKTCYRCIL